MSAVTAGFGATLRRAPLERVLARAVPSLAVLSVGFGAWYALGAQGVVPYLL
jgi:hypothetical protein